MANRAPRLLALLLCSEPVWAQSQPAAEPTPLLQGRLTIQLPASGELAAAADPGAAFADRLRFIEASHHCREAYGAVALVATGTEWLLLRAFDTAWLAGKDFAQDVAAEAIRQERADPRRRAFRVDAVPLRDRALQAFAISPSRLAPGDMDQAWFGDFAWALTVFVAPPVGSVAQLTFHVSKGDAQSSARARTVAATIALGPAVPVPPGRRDLPIRGASVLSCEIPAGYALESWDTYLEGELTVHVIRKLVPFGAPRPTLAIRYLGHFWVADAGPQIGRIPLGYAWRDEGDAERRAWPTDRLGFTAGGLSSFTVTGAGPDQASLTELLRIADSLQVVTDPARSASRPVK